MRKPILIILAVFLAIVLFILGLYFYNAYNVWRAYLTPQYTNPVSDTRNNNKQNTNKTTEVVGIATTTSVLFPAGARMMQIRIDSPSTVWWSQAVLSGSSEKWMMVVLESPSIKSMGVTYEESIGMTYNAKIFEGSCANSGASKYVLSPLVINTKGGASQTIFPLSLDTFLSQAPLSVHVYQGTDFNIPIACGTINPPGSSR